MERLGDSGYFSRPIRSVNDPTGVHPIGFLVVEMVRQFVLREHAADHAVEDRAESDGPRQKLAGSGCAEFLVVGFPCDLHQSLANPGIILLAL